MAGFIRGKQAGISNNLSTGILLESLAPDDKARFGINSKIGCLAYHADQSLLAIGTDETKFGCGQIYVFGRHRIQVTFKLSHRASVRVLQFCANYLISLDSKNQVVIWDLCTKKKLASTSPPGIATTFLTDPTLDWAFFGLQSGKVVAYDLDRKIWTPFRLPNFWHEKTERLMMSPVVSIQLHPRDIGQLLIGYSEGAVTYSFKLNKPTKYFEYTEQTRISETHSRSFDMNKVKKPKMTQAIWHPSGTFICTAFDDSTLVFWDSKDGRILMARSTTDILDSKPDMKMSDMNTLKEPLRKISWCCKENSDDTTLLIAGGIPMSSSLKGLTLLGLGSTPIYATATWQILSDFFKGKYHKILPTPPGTEIFDFYLIPRDSPHYAGAQDPIAVIALLTSGELVSLQFPDGNPISPTNQLHPSISFVHPFVTTMNVSCLNRERWLSMVEKRRNGPLFVRGGTVTKKHFKFSETQNVLLMAHGDGTVRIWDSGGSDESENNLMLQVDIARALDKHEDIIIKNMSMGSRTGELAVGTASGEVVIYNWGKNNFYGREMTECVKILDGGLTDISSRSEPNLDVGLQPRVLYNMAQGSITALKFSNIGFLGIGAESGEFSIIDLRGPVIIFKSNLSELVKQGKRSSFIKVKTAPISTSQDWAVLIEFGVMNLEGDNYSSISCFVGTHLGKVITFKILPGANGIYTAHYVGVSSLADKIISITPIISDTGRPAEATGEAVASLPSGHQFNGLLVVVSQTEIRVFKPANMKGAHKTYDDYLCEAANVVAFEDCSYALIGIFGDATIRAFSLPSLKKISSVKIPVFDVSRLSGSIITQGGSIFGWTGPSEIAILNVWGTAQSLPQESDQLINLKVVTSPRPTISNLEWFTGTQYISSSDLDLLVGGPDRPPSTQIHGQTAEEARLSRGGTQAVVQNSESWGDYMARQINERTEKLNIVGDSMDKVQESSQSWAEDVSKFVKKQKRSMMLGAVTGKFL